MMAFLVRLFAGNRKNMQVDARTNERKRSRGNRGESLTEVLVSIVVGGLATLMLAMGISVSANMNSDSRKAMSDYYTANNTIVQGTGNVDLDGRGTGQVTLKPKTGSDVEETTYKVDFALGEQTNGKLIVSYEPTASESTNESADNQGQSGGQG